MTPRREFIVTATLSLISLLLVARPGWAQPTADQVLTDMGFSAADKQRVLNGEFVTGQVTEVSERDLSVAMAFLVQESPASLSQQILADQFVAADSQVQSYGDFSGSGSLADLAGLQISDILAQTFRTAQAGEAINLTTSEIASLNTSPAGTSAIAAQLRQTLLARHQAYVAAGLAGIAPYDRGGGKVSDPAADLRKASAGAHGLSTYLPTLQAVLIGFPQATIPGMEQSFRWVNLIAHGTPTLALTHMLSAPDGAARVVVQRQFYVSTGYNAEQAVAGLLPVQQGTIVAYVNHTFTDQVAGFGGSVKRGVGERLMVSQLQKVFAAQRSKVEK